MIDRNTASGNHNLVLAERLFAILTESPLVISVEKKAAGHHFREKERDFDGRLSYWLSR